MDADELRRRSQQAELRKAAEERRKAEEEKAEKERASQREWDRQWEKARKAVAELEDTVQKAADKGKRGAVVYATFQNEFLKIQSFEKYSWWDGHMTKRWYKYNIPEYAQYVFDHCPHQLQPHWEGHSFVISRGPITDRPAPRPLEEIPLDEIENVGAIKLLLKVSW